MATVKLTMIDIYVWQFFIWSVVTPPTLVWHCDSNVTTWHVTHLSGLTLVPQVVTCTNVTQGQSNSTLLHIKQDSISFLNYWNNSNKSFQGWCNSIPLVVKCCLLCCYMNILVIMIIGMVFGRLLIFVLRFFGTNYLYLCVIGPISLQDSWTIN